MSSVFTKTGKIHIAKSSSPPPAKPTDKIATGVMNFTDIQHLLANKPLRRPPQQSRLPTDKSAEDVDDLKAIKAAKKKAKPLLYDDLRRELGLTD